MPIYKAISDKQVAVVLDIGTAYTKFGFSGEFAPRCIFKSEVPVKNSDKTKRIWDYSSKEELYDMLVDFIHIVYFKYALLSPKDRPIVIVESLLCPTLFRETLAKVLFLHYEISTVLVLPSHLVSLVSFPLETALVVDVGYEEAVVIPVCHGLPILQAWQALPLGAKAIHKNIRTLLGNPNLSESDVEDIKVRCCFVTSQSRAQELARPKPTITPCPDVKYPLGGTQSITITGKIRERSFEILYEEDNDHLCLSTMILDAIKAVNVDLRRKLSENLVLIGGTTMTPGFKSRLKEELLKQLKNDTYKVLKIESFKFHTPSFRENYGAWLGGSISGATDMLQIKGLAKENYLVDNRLPDWVNLKDNRLHA